MTKKKKIAFIFPGQGAQYPGMAKDFADAFASARETFEEADDHLARNLSQIVFNGPEELLMETRNSQAGIYVASMAILRTVNSLFPDLKPGVCAGLSLGEYTALTATGRLGFSEGLSLVQHRGQFMNDACETTQGTMAVVLGLDAETIEGLVKEVNLPNDLWTANFNCPGQIVISGTLKGIEAGSAAAKSKGAKRILPLAVHGAFHSGLMQLAEERLAAYIESAPLNNSDIELVMNVTGGPVSKLDEVRHNLIKQVTHAVRWEQSIRYMMNADVDLFVEMGCGKTLAGFNKRIGVSAPCISIENIKDISLLEEQLKLEF
jgi:[acyl-carrier-protein] S-malonyltransferase